MRSRTLYCLVAFCCVWWLSGGNTPASGATVVVDFDALDTSSVFVTGPTLDAYMAGYGLSIINVVNGPVVVDADYRHYGGGVLDTPSSPNFMATYGSASAPTSYSIQFPSLVNWVELTVPAILVPSAHPAMTMSVLDTAGSVLSSVSPWFYSTHPAITFHLSGPGISTLKLDGNAYNWAAWTGVFFDNLTYDVAVPEPSSAVLLLGCASIVACVALRRRRRSGSEC